VGREPQGVRVSRIHLTGYWRCVRDNRRGPLRRGAPDEPPRCFDPSKSNVTVWDVTSAEVRHSGREKIQQNLIDRIGTLQVAEVSGVGDLEVAGARNDVGNLPGQVRRNHPVVGESDRQARHGDRAVGLQPIEFVIHPALGADPRGHRSAG